MRLPFTNPVKKSSFIFAFIIMFLNLSFYGQVKVKDTFFIKKDSIRGTAQSIFIDPNRNSEFYHNISYWKFLEFDAESFKISTDYFEENKLKLTKRKPVIPWTKWVILKQYHGKFYAYHPCDFYTHYRVSVNDSAYIDWTGEGPVANKILSQQKINDNTYTFDLTGIYNKDRKLVIHIIDKKKGIALFKEMNNGMVEQYYLMIAADKIRKVPLIVNRCDFNKQLELNFEVPNYKKLLEKK